MTETKKFKILSLDGGGSKGVYTLGVLYELEKKLGGKLHEHFDLIYGTSTGAIIGSGIAIGMSIDEIINFYYEHIPQIMKNLCASSRSAALQKALDGIFKERTFADVKTDLGVVTANTENEKPAIFKSNVKFAHGSQATFAVGFGARISDAVAASCSAYPLFKIKAVETTNQGTMQLIDGGFVANNPAFFALTDATRAFNVDESDIRILSVGVGRYNKSKPLYAILQGIRHLGSVSFLEKQLNLNSNTLTTLFQLFSKKIKSERVDEASLDISTNLLESNKTKLKKMQILGRETYGKLEPKIIALF